MKLDTLLNALENFSLADQLAILDDLIEFIYVNNGLTEMVDVVCSNLAFKDHELFQNLVAQSLQNKVYEQPAYQLWLGKVNEAIGVKGEFLPKSYSLATFVSEHFDYNKLPHFWLDMHPQRLLPNTIVVASREEVVVTYLWENFYYIYHLGLERFLGAGRPGSKTLATGIEHDAGGGTVFLTFPGLVETVHPDVMLDNLKMALQSLK